MILSGNKQDLQDLDRPFYYFFRCIALVTSALTIAGSTWYISVNLTTPSDLTAIYNCSAFFAYAFSIPLLNERPRPEKIISVLVAIVGVLVVAYGDGADETDPKGEVSTRLGGNILIGIGSVLYGLYEVLFKKLLCPPDGTSAGSLTIFLVAITDNILFGRQLTTAAISGGLLIIAAFALLSWATWREMTEVTSMEIEIDSDSEERDD
ncbi:hypothetical protein Dda_7764 [Drechslerella dactyloides]|uniref:EamA domain-containing protein n=1 Tax=Drechslerella dactyloides TaxID=74499 RepID=A0AAD6ITY0_DREDA|nr:hypothetical protein Dda_7764 [Drechslerella dactyloides]